MRSAMTRRGGGRAAHRFRARSAGAAMLAATMLAVVLAGPGFAAPPANPPEAKPGGAGKTSTVSATPHSGAPRGGFVRDDATVLRALKDELDRSMKALKVGDAPLPYYLAYAFSDVDQATVSATFGAVTGAYGVRGRMLRTDVRVGDPSFDNSNFPDAFFGGGQVQPLPVDDDYAALRRELWLRTDEAYKGAVETLAKKRAAAAGQVEDDQNGTVPDFALEKPLTVTVPFPAEDAEPALLRETVRHLSSVFREYPDIIGCRVSGTYAIIRRRFISSEGAVSDERRATVRIDAVAEAQAGDGMRLSHFVPFTALTPAGLPPLAEMEKAVRRMATELVAMRTAPVASSGTASVLFEGLAAAQLTKLLLGDHLSGTPAPRTAGGGEERGHTSELSGKLGQKIASPFLMAVDDPSVELGPDKEPLFGSYRVDDEGIGAERVVLVERGILKGLLMTRTPSRDIAHSNGHARSPRFSAPRAGLGNLIVSGRPGAPEVGLARSALLARMRKIAQGGGVESYIVRLLDEPNVPGVGDGEDSLSMLSLSGSGRSAPPIKPLVVYRLTASGKEELVRGLTLEGLVPRSLRDIGALGRDVIVYNFHEGGAGFTGIPTSIVTPPLLLFDVDVRRSQGKHRRPPAYPRPPFSAATDDRDTRDARSAR